MANTKDDRGYWLVAADGGVFTFGDAPFYGAFPGATSSKTVAISNLGINPGYAITYDNGLVAFFNHGPATEVFLPQLNARVVGSAIDQATKSGYWLAAADGGVITFGGAPFYGSLGNQTLDAPVVGIAVSSYNLGYLLLDSRGEVASFGQPFACCKN
jgi:hypothetical protein